MALWLDLPQERRKDVALGIPQGVGWNFVKIEMRPHHPVQQSQVAPFCRSRSSHDLDKAGINPTIGQVELEGQVSPIAGDTDAQEEALLQQAGP
ncbi:hypothetical protein [Paracoccus rhizosphaerae]|uniref:Uncharacterized protein n=1 Tax=Paracoccus rhizosphaerae TaxID=1133347 RepID=A0ABV6CI09_9RHOB|nr:hypothetical protein [Paracoccus rhizosphaerae]